MQKVYLLFIYMLLTIVAGSAQSVKEQLTKAIEQFENDVQMKHAMYSLLVMDAKTGKIIFEKNTQTGLATASCLKIVTSATAFELLGKDYRYHTSFLYNNANADSTNIYVSPNGDPTFGSWRYAATSENTIFKNIADAMLKSNLPLKKISSCYIVNQHFSKRFFPEGWIWQDVGNYYGAGQGALNWRENQFDIMINTSDKKPNENISAETTKLSPAYTSIDVNTDELKTGAKGSGDNVYVYLNPADSRQLLITGTAPAGDKNFSVSVTHTNPNEFFANYLKTSAPLYAKADLSNVFKNIHTTDNLPAGSKTFYTYYSPTLDSIVYWFLKKSINLYGEALIRSFALEKKGFGSTEDGVKLVQDFWKQKGIDETSLNIFDGSGLSPQNRVTTDALAKILYYAKQQPWFQYYYNAFPEYNGMKLKSGTIGSVKGFCGYHTARNGNQYIVAFLINNYSGSSSAIVLKMYEVLNVLK